MEKKELPVVEAAKWNPNNKERDAITYAGNVVAFIGNAIQKLSTGCNYDAIEIDVRSCIYHFQKLVEIIIPTEYATKLHQAEEKIKELDFDNKRLSSVLEGRKEAVEELKKLTAESDKQRKEANDQLREAKRLLNEVFRKHESGLLPDRFIYEKIKTFLYGE